MQIINKGLHSLTSRQLEILHNALEFSLLRRGDLMNLLEITIGDAELRELQESVEEVQDHLRQYTRKLGINAQVAADIEIIVDEDDAA